MDRHWFAQNKKEKDVPNSSSSSGSSEATGGGGGVNTAEMKERSETSPAHRGGGSGQSSNKEEDESGKDAKTRGDTTAKKNELRELMERDPPCIDCFSFLSFLAYILYPPLFIAGPIVTYNAFVNQLFHTGFGQAKTGLMLIVRALFWAFVLEVLLHFVYLYAVSVDRLWLLPGLSPFYVASTGYFTLNFMYIKFLSIWMYFRGFSHVDGVISPNNLIRCVNNNYTFTGFWRQWHASLNKWVLRYLYIPLGGKKSQWWSIWVIFFFIGVWHDLFLVWIAWAMLNCVFFTLEIGVLYAGYAYRNVLARIPMYEVVISWAGALNIFLLMIANLAILYGFGGTKLFLERMFLSDGGWKVFIAAVSSFYAGVRGMRAIRQREERMGLQSDDERRT
uniref:Uncharacterized protein n=1 Tax=Palpitomonas bilix TaxID=652834 RepID=A0A7S3LVY8_9EUKA|mmetsp:Transcript_5573/g.12897  ORF Transcript_5573/g.12897 Transcript_5573/m.12897 type:complete len:391 (+) Transcript_5573:572-1744(+)